MQIFCANTEACPRNILQSQLMLLSYYCKQGTKMRWLVCMSADIYCQIANKFYLRNNIILYSNGKKGKRACCERDRERVSERRRVAENGVGICHKTAVGRRMNYFGISREPNVRITFSWETILMRKGDRQRYIKITKIEIIFADAWWHSVTTFHLRFPYDDLLCYNLEHHSWVTHHAPRVIISALRVVIYALGGHLL